MGPFVGYKKISCINVLVFLISLCLSHQQKQVYLIEIFQQQKCRKCSASFRAISDILHQHNIQKITKIKEYSCIQQKANQLCTHDNLPYVRLTNQGQILSDVQGKKTKSKYKKWLQNSIVSLNANFQRENIQIYQIQKVDIIQSLIQNHIFKNLMKEKQFETDTKIYKQTGLKENYNAKQQSEYFNNQNKVQKNIQQQYKQQNLHINARLNKINADQQVVSRKNQQLQSKEQIKSKRNNHIKQQKVKSQVQQQLQSINQKQKQQGIGAQDNVFSFKNFKNFIISIMVALTCFICIFFKLTKSVQHGTLLNSEEIEGAALTGLQ